MKTRTQKERGCSFFVMQQYRGDITSEKCPPAACINTLDITGSAMQISKYRWSSGEDLKVSEKEGGVCELANIKQPDVGRTYNGRSRKLSLHSRVIFARSSYFANNVFVQMHRRHSHPRGDNYFGNKVRKEEGVLPIESIGEATESYVKPGRGKFRETPTPLRKKTNVTMSHRKEEKEGWHARYVNRSGATLRLCTRKHEWTFTPQTFPPYRSTRMREISLLENLDRNRGEREQNCTRFRHRVQWIKKVDTTRYQSVSRSSCLLAPYHSPTNHLNNLNNRHATSVSI